MKKEDWFLLVVSVLVAFLTGLVFGLRFSPKTPTTIVRAECRDAPNVVVLPEPVILREGVDITIDSVRGTVVQCVK